MKQQGNWSNRFSLVLQHYNFNPCYLESRTTNAFLRIADLVVFLSKNNPCCMSELAFPILGGICAAVLFTSPLFGIFKLKPYFSIVPIALIIVNTIAWIFYATATRDVLLFWPNFYGLFVGLLGFSAYIVKQTKKRLSRNAAPEELTRITSDFEVEGAKRDCVSVVEDKVSTADRLDWSDSEFLRQLKTGLIVLTAVTPLLLLSLFLCVYFSIQDTLSLSLPLAIFANVILLSFYTFPLLTIYKVIKTRNAAYLFLPLSVTTSLNGFFWAIYGIIKQNYWIWVVNAIGGTIGVLEVVTFIIFSCVLSVKNSASLDTEA